MHLREIIIKPAQNLFLVAFGELDISPLTVGVLLGLSLFTFLAVGVSSFNLVQSAFKKDKE